MKAQVRFPSQKLGQNEEQGRNWKKRSYLNLTSPDSSVNHRESCQKSLVKQRTKMQNEHEEWRTRGREREWGRSVWETRRTKASSITAAGRRRCPAMEEEWWERWRGGFDVETERDREWEGWEAAKRVREKRVRVFSAIYENVPIFLFIYFSILNLYLKTKFWNNIFTNLHIFSFSPAIGSSMP